MNPSRPYILRPVATSLLMVAIVILGAIGYLLLPVSTLPEVDYPTIEVKTFLPGASPDVMAATVTGPLEREFGQMPGLSEMSSSSSAGASVVTLQFDLSLDIDVAEAEVQAAISAANSLLPQSLPAPPTYAKVNPADAPVLTLAATSSTMPITEGRGPGRHPHRGEDLPGRGRRPREPERRTAAGGAHPRQSAAARRLRPERR